MINTEQGVLQQGTLLRALIHILLLYTFFISFSVYAASAGDTLLSGSNNSHKQQLIIYMASSEFQSKIAHTLSKILTDRLPDLQTITVDVENTLPEKVLTPNLVIAIGPKGINSAKKYYPDVDKLMLPTDTDNNYLKPGAVNDAILYMVQPYCRQIQFIKLFNDKWNAISLLYSREKPVDIKAILQCAKDSDIKIYTLETNETATLTDKIKNALTHSDLLLALPDKSIYNSKTVKNILLTSYRLRKPVFAFSNNFVNAGALASIHSTAEQIAQDAGNIIESYFEQDRHFINVVNYPHSYDISINRQVLRALDLPSPETTRLKQILEQSETDRTGYLK